MQDDANLAIATPKKQLNWRQAAAPAEARLGNPHHAPS